MSRSWRTFDHPSDLGLEARADTLGELFEALAEGLAAQLCRRGAQGEVTVPVGAASEDVEALLVDFLGELLKLFHVDRFVPARIRVRRCDETSVRASVDGETYDPARHELGPEIKAVTYHQLKVAREGECWTGRVILDL